jgi:hypothetical protein
VVTVDTDIIELVVEAYRLGLLISLKQRARVPQTNVLDRVFIPRDRRGRQVRQGRIGGLLDGLELVGLACELDVVLQIGGLERQFARLHKELLKDDGQNQDSDNIEGNVDPGSQEERSESRAEEIEREQCTCRRRDGDHDPQGNPRHMIRRIASSIDDAQSRVDEAVVIEVESKSPVGNQNKKKHGQM